MQVVILCMLDPETLRLFVDLAPSPDDCSTAGSLTINTVDYGKMDAKIAYPSRSAFAAAAATTPTTYKGPSPSYQPPSPPPDFLLSEQGDVVFTPETDHHKVAAMSSYAAHMAAATPKPKILSELRKQLAMYRSFMLHFPERNPADKAFAHFQPFPQDFVH